MKISKNQSSTTWCSLDPYPTPLAYNIFVNCWAGKWRICERLATWESISTRIYDLKLTSKPIEVVVWLSALAYAKESSREMGFQSVVSLQWLTQSKMNNIDHQHLSNIQSTALKCEAWYCLAPHPSSSWWVASTSPCRIQWITATSLNDIARTHTIAIGCNGSFRIISVTSYMYGFGKLQWCQDELLEDPIWKEQSFSNHLTSKVLNPFLVSVWVVFDLDYTYLPKTPLGYRTLPHDLPP